MPSLKLIMFTIATNQMIVSGYWAGPRSPTPRNGSVTWSMVRPAETGIAAQATCPSSLTEGDSPQMSSTAPSAQISTAPTIRAREVGSAGRKYSTGTRNPARIARPPRRGVGSRWMRRSDG